MKHKHDQNSKQNKTVYAIDFDGTLCNNYFPEIGEPNIALIEYLKQLQTEGNILILWTCRCGQLLEDAIGYAWSRFRWQIKFQLWLHSRRMARNKHVRQVHDYNKHCAEVDQYLNDHNL